MYSLVYEPGIPGVSPIDLSGGDYTVGQATGLRSTSWTYTLAAAGLSGVGASARETTLTVSARTPELLDRPNRVFDAEMRLGKPGTLVIDGQWRQKCYVTKTSTSGASTAVDAPSTQQWTVVLLDGTWTRLLPVEHFNPVTSTATGLDLPTDLPLDLAAGGFTRYVQNESLSPVDWRMTVFGPVTGPHITIGGNIIELTGSIPDGSYATIDSRRRTITLTNADGSTQNVFDWGVRATGVGSGHYVFERIPAGQSVVSWPSSFSFDLQLVESRMDPTWGGVRVIPVDAIHPAPITIGYGAGVEALARTTTVRWSDGHTSTEPIVWEPLTGTDVPGATIIARGHARGLAVTQRVTVQPDLLDVSEMDQSAFETGPDYDSRWSQQADGGWAYSNPAGSGVKEHAGRSWGGHLGGVTSVVGSAVVLQPGDYTLCIPVTKASGFPSGSGSHYAIALSYRLSSDHESWDKDVYYRARWWTQPTPGTELRMRVHVGSPSLFGFSIAFDAIPGTALEFGKPMLLEGTLANAVAGEVVIPDLTEVGFDAAATLPTGWNTGHATPEKVPSTVTPAGRTWSYKLDNNGWIITPYAAINKGDRFRVTLLVSRWSESENLIFGSSVNYEWGVSEPWGIQINATDLPVGQWVEKSYDTTAQHEGMANISIWTGGGNTAHIASMRVERLVG